jgi:hypothetical protein
VPDFCCHVSKSDNSHRREEIPGPGRWHPGGVPVCARPDSARTVWHFLAGDEHFTASVCRLDEISNWKSESGRDLKQTIPTPLIPHVFFLIVAKTGAIRSLTNGTSTSIEQQPRFRRVVCTVCHRVLDSPVSLGRKKWAAWTV